MREAYPLVPSPDSLPQFSDTDAEFQTQLPPILDSERLWSRTEVRERLLPPF